MTTTPMKRNGKTLSDLGDGHPRRLSDARNAWRKMSPAQRRTFLDWMVAEVLPVDAAEPEPPARGFTMKVNTTGEAARG